jgi:hypothetical protein
VKQLAWKAGVAGLGLSAAVLGGSIASGADHRDSTLIGMAASSAADINDVYAWMSSSGEDLNLAMTVQPFAAAGATFSADTQYVFHVTSRASYGATAVEETRVICEFAGATSAECWIGDEVYLSGDPSSEAGVSDAASRARLFAGQRNDPFYFNLDGFQATVALVKAAAAGLTFDAAGCPAVDAGTSAALRNQLQNDDPADAEVDDEFAGANIAAIVLTLDKTLVDRGGPILGVWASTHDKP